MKRFISLLFSIVFCILLFVQCRKTHVTNDICDCASSQSTYVVDTITLVVTNIFTPCVRDGKNDFWYIKNIDKFPDCKIKVSLPGLFGGTVFESTGYTGYQFWDGSTKNNKALKDGKYKYEITIGNYTFKGFVCIFRGEFTLKDDNCLSSCVARDLGDPLLNN